MKSVPTVGGRRLTASHDSITQLDDLWNADDALGMITFVRQQDQEVEDVRNQHFRAPENKHG